MNALNWTITEKRHGFMMTARSGDYVAVIETVTPDEDTGFRNRSWAVSYAFKGSDYLIATGFCNGTEVAEKMVMAVIGNRS